MLSIHGVDGYNYLINIKEIKMIKGCGDKVYIYIRNIDSPIVSSIPYERLVVLIGRDLDSNAVKTTPDTEYGK
ncbi:hypothetical protein ACQFN5_00145 (plasmid) [Klebsiella sp. WOUb02]|uniref:hypothetical protein n=1 Tax=Klebsiella sp. WOUb02 TaxID=3161071 RepID=UPI003CEECAEE